MTALMLLLAGIAGMTFCILRGISQMICSLIAWIIE